MLDIALRKQHGNFQLDLAFQSDGAKVTALFGRSGSGKTSVINMVAGLVRPDQGRVAVDGRVLFDGEKGIDLPPPRRRVGYVFQEGRLFPHYTVRGNLTYGMERTPASERFIQFDQVIDVLGIGALLDRRPSRLSGGEKQRVAIGRALLSSPRLLLMDEPLAALDGARKDELLPFIALLPGQFGVPILYVSHAVDEVLRLADHLLLMNDGKLEDSGTVEDVMGRSGFAEVSGRRDPASIVTAMVTQHDRLHGTTHLSFPGGVIRVPLLSAPAGRKLRVRIDAGDVMLSLTRPTGLSVQNIFPARVVSLRHESGLVDVGLDLGCMLHAQISEQAYADLGLNIGLPLYALVKTAAISRSDIAEHEPAKDEHPTLAEEEI
ncbi:molybdenum ABC transporter ATP-binding protein [Telmatospirillum siberiense]|uniref:Molybdenum ABC transporter ATP-binding protein n=1 Tax=Telmatospirillum siberiense TaxID=382514 RepID=A0A2N3PR11_9PROT|nr:molybdenum ABC transporter ATP-binding protein [Telmatospirillum siberiense]PKU22843.1 molybdenum ABC transporter ATP-binding protein [Telmatospirillum siberiense]